jgi:hypothetical protein
MLLLLLAACNKNNDSGKPVSTTPNFKVTGLQDVDLSNVSGNSYSFSISVVANPGQVDTVFLYANDLPGGLYVDFLPINGITPFSSVVTVRAYTSSNATYTIHIRAVGRSGIQSYDMKVTLPGFKGWQLDDVMFSKTTAEKNAGTATITARSSNGGQISLMFDPAVGLPTSNRTYTIGSTTEGGKMMISVWDNSRTWLSTGNAKGGTATGTFTFDPLGKFTFKCSDVEMADSTLRKSLTCSFGE